MDTKICKDCTHFRQHYVKFGERYGPIWYGHCVYPRLKRRESASPACEHFQAKPNKKQKKLHCVSRYIMQLLYVHIMKFFKS